MKKGVIRKQIPFAKLSVFTVVALFLVSLTATAFAKEVTWTGCGITKKAFMGEIAKAYEAKTGIKITLSGGGATKGIRSASAGTSQMGGTCRMWVGGEANKHAQEASAKLTQVAWDAIVVVAHPDNPVDNITSAQLKDIYDGKITNWNQLGGPDKRIALITRNGKQNGVGYIYRLLAYNDGNADFKARSLKVKSTGPLEKKVEATATAMGLDGISSAKKRNLKFLSLDGIAPTKENIGSGKYPLFRPLYLATGPGSSPDAIKVVDFVLSAEGQKIVSDQGTVNLEEGKAINSIWEAKKKNFKY